MKARMPGASTCAASALPSTMRSGPLCGSDIMTGLLARIATPALQPPPGPGTAGIHIDCHPILRTLVDAAAMSPMGRWCSWQRMRSACVRCKYLYRLPADVVLQVSTASPYLSSHLSSPIGIAPFLPGSEVPQNPVFPGTAMSRLMGDSGLCGLWCHSIL